MGNTFLNNKSSFHFSSSLHALRGLAALIVVFDHLWILFFQQYKQFSVGFNPFNGSACVVFFFVLSGLVVGASFINQEGQPNHYLTYFLRRFFRMMPLMAVMAFIGGIYNFTIDKDMPFHLYESEWGRYSLTTWIVSFLGYSLKSNPPSWSIWVEIVASILIPLMVWTGAMSRLVLITFSALVLVTFLPVKTQHYWHLYMISFYAGLIALAWGKQFVNLLSSKSDKLVLWIPFVCVLAFYLPRVIINSDFFGNNLIVLWETFFITPVVAILYFNDKNNSLLKTKVFQFFGDISFSIYLVHFIILVNVFNAIYLSIYLSGIPLLPQ